MSGWMSGCQVHHQLFLLESEEVSVPKRKGKAYLLVILMQDVCPP